MPTEKPIRLIPSLTGAAGTYFVAAELCRRGYIATLTIRNAPGIDLLVANATADRTVNIQVKTNQGSQKKWILSNKAEKLIADNLFYVFVNLNGKSLPAFHIVDSAFVAAYCERTHREWLAKESRDGAPHKENSVREFHDTACVHLDAWDRLGLDAD